MVRDRDAQSPERDLPLKRGQLESLRDYLFEHFEDPRRNNRSFRASTLLVIIAMALFAGRDNLAAIQRYGQFLTQSQREWLCLPKKKDAKGRKVPSYTALRNLLIQIDPQTFAACLSGWLQANLGTLPRALAIDGKWIRDRALTFDPANVTTPQLDTALKDRPFGGMGIYLIRKMTDEAEFLPLPGGGNEIRLIKRGVIQGELGSE